MRISHALIQTALLGAAIVVSTSASAANLSMAQKRTLAVSGNHSPAFNTAARFAKRVPGSGYQVLYNFAGGAGDGQSPTAEVTLDSSGNIYGTTEGGGANGTGVLFKLTSGGSESILHSFGGSGDGTSPDGAVNIDSSGNIFGTTDYGGSGDNGTIWELAANGTYSVLHSFASNEGNFVRGRMLEGKKGNFFGTALFGGVNGDGTVFEYANGTLTILHAFNGNDGEFPEHGLATDGKGNAYGATAFGGADDNGTLYKIASDGTFSTLYNFTGGADGGFIYGAVAADVQGNVYGNTASGGAFGFGTVFKLSPNGTLTTLYSFTGGTDGGSPEGDMLLAGNYLFSTATSGGDPSCGCGGVYQIARGGAEKMLQAFTPSGGDGYSAGVTASGKLLYGTTAGGGTNGDGVVFSLKNKTK
ncbi:MAG TPA: choice-of-anchor tandem repeat GloVer-containing protein [Rhizomicrobium sp.]|jgi:uncharacterized repeat protein (TIGR03803 family)|nr:choice-of-anchor tandem repeat GloVer-containing protein [Rhizomicrobium sp.]